MHEIHLRQQFGHMHNIMIINLYLLEDSETYPNLKFKCKNCCKVPVGVKVDFVIDSGLGRIPFKKISSRSLHKCEIERSTSVACLLPLLCTI